MHYWYEKVYKLSFLKRLSSLEGAEGLLSEVPL